MNWTEEQVRELHREHWDDGVSLAELARRLDLSREAIRQQFKKYDLPRRSVSDHARRGREANQAAAEAQRQRIIALYKEYGSVDDVAAIVQLPRDFVAPIVASIPNREAYRRRGDYQTYSREELIEFLRRAHQHLGLGDDDPLTIPGYREAARELSLPSYNTYLPHFAKVDPINPWQAALAAAGLPANTPRGRRSTSITDDECVEAVARYIQHNDGERGSYEGYRTWAETAGAPSGSRVRQAGRWGVVVEEALDRLARA